MNKLTSCFNLEFINISQFKQTQSYQCSQCDAPKAAYLSYFCENCQSPYHYRQESGQCQKCQYFSETTDQSISEPYEVCINREIGCGVLGFSQKPYKYVSSYPILLDEQEKNGSYITDKQIKCLEQCSLPYQLTEDLNCTLCDQQQIIHYNMTCEDNDDCLFSKQQTFQRIIEKDFFNTSICYGNNIDDLNKTNCSSYQKVTNNYYCYDTECQQQKFYFQDYYNQCLNIICQDGSILDTEQMRCKVLDDVIDDNVLFRQKDNFLIYQDQLKNITNKYNLQSSYKSIKNCNDNLIFQSRFNKYYCMHCQNYILYDGNIYNSEYDFKCVDKCPENYFLFQKQKQFNQELCLYKDLQCKFKTFQQYFLNNTCIDNCFQKGYYKNTISFKCVDQTQNYTYLYINNMNDYKENQQYDYCKNWLYFYDFLASQVDFKSQTCIEECNATQNFGYIYYNQEINKTIKHCYGYDDAKRGNISTYQSQLKISNAIYPQLNTTQIDTTNIIGCKTFINYNNQCDNIGNCKLYQQLTDYSQYLNIVYRNGEDQREQLKLQLRYCLSQETVQNQTELCNKQYMIYDSQQKTCINCQYYFNTITNQCQDEVCEYLKYITNTTTLFSIDRYYCIQNDQCIFKYINESKTFCYESCDQIGQKFQYNDMCLDSCIKNNLLVNVQQKKCYNQLDCKYQMYHNQVKFSLLGEIICQQQCQQQYGINLLTNPKTCFACSQYIKVLFQQNQSCIDQFDCSYIYNTNYCGFLKENEEEYQLPECQLILYNQKICQSLQQIQQNEQFINKSTELDCKTLNDNIQLIQNYNNNICQISCFNTINDTKIQQFYILIEQQNQQYPRCQDECNGVQGTYLQQQNLTFCFQCQYYDTILDQSNICLDNCQKYFENKTCADRNPESCHIYNNICYEQCPNDMISENNICTKVNKKLVLIISISSIAFIILLIIIIILAIKCYQRRKRRQKQQEEQYNIQMLRSTKYKLNYEQTIV